MAITLRTDTQQDEALENFMKLKGHATKSKAILWLIENGLNLCESHEKLNAITEGYERIAAEKEMIAELLSLD